MTIEEKAKAYDEALEKIKVLQEDWKSTHNLAWIEIEEVFPQLAESEDKRIRDVILNCMYYCSDRDFITQEERNDAIAYLEKQKEPKMLSRADFVKQLTDYLSSEIKPYHEKLLQNKASEWEKGFECGLIVTRSHINSPDFCPEMWEPGDKWEKR